MALGVLWALLMPRTADLAAQDYRIGLFAREGFTLWDNAWFAGHQLLNYSLVSPSVGAILGLRPAGLLAVAISVVCADRILARLRPGAGPWPGVWFAAAAAGDLFIGRVTFALGTAVAMLALVALINERPIASALLSAAAAATSPVVGLLLLVILCAAFPRRAALWAATASAATVAACALLFSDGGTQPDDPANAAARLTIIAALWALLPRHERFLRRACALYALAMIATFAVASPMGSNIARLGVLAAGPVLVCAGRRFTPRQRVAFAALAVAIAGWQLWAPVTESAKAHENPATTATYYRPLLAALHRQRIVNERVEVVPTSTRWESVYVARHYPLARGWESQLDRRYDALFYRDRLSPDSYRRWLDAARVGYVAVSTSTPERWGRTEAQLLRRPPSYLRLVWQNRDWRLFALRHARPIAVGAQLVSMASAEIDLHFAAPGRAHIAVHPSSYWHTSADACVEADGNDMTVIAPHRGTVRLTAHWPPNGDGC